MHGFVMQPDCETFLGRLFRCPSRNAGLLEQFCRGRLVAKICLKKLKTPNDQFLIFQLQDGLDQVVKL